MSVGSTPTLAAMVRAAGVGEMPAPSVPFNQMIMTFSACVSPFSS